MLCLLGAFGGRLFLQSAGYRLPAAVLVEKVYNMFAFAFVISSALVTCSALKILYMINQL